jgi:DNA (cytosine-5)-methyltransferase 1
VSHQIPAVVGAGVRRLTPRECERLQGFPDDYTLIPTHKRNWSAEEAEMRAYFKRTLQDLSDEEIERLAADGPRYKAIGNSMAIPVMRWIGERIQAVEKETRP